MNVSEKRARIWRKDLQTKDGREFYRYTTSVSKAKDDGTYARVYFDIKFARKSGAPEKITNGAQCDYEGFVTVDSFPGKDGKEVTKPVIMVMKVQFDTDPEDLGGGFEQVDDPVPF